MKVIDLTHTLKESMPLYPGTDRPRLKSVSTYEKNHYRETEICIFSHVGTHIDPPSHITKEGKTLDSFSADTFVGNALIIDCRDLQNGEQITMKQLEVYCDKLKQVDFLLFNTGWDKKWGTEDYFYGYPCIDDTVLEFIINERYKGIGFDTISLDPVSSTTVDRHKKLFAQSEIINIENLTNLDLCYGGIFLLCCLPLKYENSDGAPARAIALLDC